MNNSIHKEIPVKIEFGVTEHVKDIARSQVEKGTITTIQKLPIPGFSIVNKDFYKKGDGTIVDQITDFYIIFDVD